MVDVSSQPSPWEPIYRLNNDYLKSLFNKNLLKTPVIEVGKPYGFEVVPDNILKNQDKPSKDNKPNDVDKTKQPI